MQHHDIKARDNKIHEILSVAPKIDTITYMSAILMAVALYAHRASLYPQNATIAAIFFSTALMITNFTISIAIDWLRSQIEPHLQYDPQPPKKKSEPLTSIIKNAVPTIRLFATLTTLIFTIVIYHSVMPDQRHQHAHPLYYKYLVTLILLALPTAYTLITFYGTLMEKIRQHATAQPQAKEKISTAPAKAATTDA